jgi:aminopeptidase N
MRNLSYAAALAASILSSNCSVSKDAMSTTHNASQDIHSCARPHEVRVRHVSLDLALDFDAKVARGTCTLTLQRLANTAPLWLDCDGLRISSVVSAAGEALAYEIGKPDPNLGSSLRVDLPAGVDVVRIAYETSDGAGALQWLAPEQTSGPKPFLFSQGQAILTRTWIPLQDSPAVRVTWDARIRSPKGLRPLMSAQQRGGSHDEGWTFAMPQAVPSYLIAIACGQIEERAISPRCAVWAEPSVVDRASRELEDMERMVASCEELFGPYRWGRYDVLFLPSSFPFGGMENPCMTFATPTILAGDKSLVALVAHELAHSWSGNLVTNATWRDFWLNEGFTVYLEQRIMEHVYGEERMRMEIALSMRQLAQELRSMPREDQRLHIDLAGRNPDDGMTSVPYDKGAALLRRLEGAFGRARFDAFLRAWFDEHAFQSVTTSEFRAFLDERLLSSDRVAAAAIDLDAWIESDGLPADAPSAESAGFLAVDKARTACESQRSAEPLLAAEAKAWNTQQWLRFLAEPKFDAQTLEGIDQAYSLSRSGNCEILCAWLDAGIRANYAPAFATSETFLMTVGRRKYLKPLYEALLQSPGGRERALLIYQRARPRYHAVAVRTLDALLEVAPK